MKKIFLFSAVSIFLTGNSIFAQFVVPPLPSTPVYDEVNILTAEDKTTLEQKILTLEKETNHQIGIAIIKNLQGRTVEETAITIARAWGIGQEKLDNGLLILVAIEDRETRIEVGRGLEGVMTDLMSDRVIDENFLPNFREGRYGPGLIEGIDRITPLIRGEVLELPEQNNVSSEDLQGILIFIVFFGWAFLSILSASKSWWLGGVAGGIIGAIFLGTLGAVLVGIGGLILDFLLSKFAYGQIPFLRAMGNNRWGGGGGFGGGSSGGGWGGFGGGGFGGGGASGKW